MADPISNPLSPYFDTSGAPLDAGYLYFGEVGSDPETSPITVYFDEAATIPAAQPIRTQAGYPYRSGAPAILFGADGFSLKVKDRRGVTVYYAPYAKPNAENIGAERVDLDLEAEPSAGSLLEFLLRQRDHTAGYVCPSDYPYNADRTGATDATDALIACISENASTMVLPGTYRINTSVVIAATGSNRKIFCQPGVKFLSYATPGNAPEMFYFQGTGDRLQFVGNGVQIGYAAAPTARLYHTVYVRGGAITNLEITGLDITNGGNMAVAVFCGGDNSVAAGSKNISVHDCRFANTLGDGAHIEGADSGVRLYNLSGENIGDDMTAVLNYIGAGSAPTHPTPTVGVLIRGIQVKDAHTSFVSIGGIQEFVIDDIQGSSAAGSTVFGINFAKSSDYGVGNSNGTIDNVVGTGVSKLLTFDAGGSGGAYNRNIRVGAATGHGVTNTAISMSNAGAAADGIVENIEIEQIDLRDAAVTATVGYIGKTRDCRIGRLTGNGFGAGLGVFNNIGFSWGAIRLKGFVVATPYAMAIATNTDTRAGTLEIDDTNCTTGLIFQTNAGVVHDGGWRITGGSAHYLFGSNTSVRGIFDTLADTINVGTVTAGSQTTITYARAAPSGCALLPSLDIASNEGERWGFKNLLYNQVTMLWTDAQTTVYVSYQIGLQAA